MNEKLIQSSMDEILKSVTDVKITIGEKLFVSKYLPLFLNIKDREIAIKEWLNVCKNPYYSVNIVNYEGKTILIVPPLLIRQETRVITDGMYSFSEILERTRQKTEVFPKQGDKFFNECMDVIRPKERNKGNWDKWDTILQRYGYGKKPDDEIEVNDNSMEDLEYEDF